MNQEKKLSKCLMTMLKICLEILTNQNKEKDVKILTPKQMLQRLRIALAQVKAGNSSENLLNEIRQIVYSFYQSLNY